MNKAKRCKIEYDLCHLINTVNLDQYLDDIDKGILKFVNKQFHKKYEKITISINTIYPMENLRDWYIKYFNIKLSLMYNFNWIILNDYHNIFKYSSFELYTERNMHIILVSHLFDMILIHDAIKCAKFIVERGYTITIDDLLSSCTRNKPNVFQLCIENAPLWHFSNNYIIDLCIKYKSNDVLYLLNNKYGIKKND
jgi:hypothetical protein